MIIDISMVQDAARALVAMLVVLWSAIVMPTTGHCPERWYVNGVRPSGRYQCLPVLGDPGRDIEDARARVDFHDERSVEGEIYCTGGAHPIVVGPRTVGCQR